jgi:hypothetical protein
MAGLPEIRVKVDWANDAFFQPVMASTDPLNILTDPLYMTTIPKTPTPVGGSASYSEMAETTEYGLRKFRVTSGTNAFGGFSFGWNGTTPLAAITVSPSTNYRIAVWVKGVSNYTSVPVTITVVDEDNATISGTAVSATLSSGWQKITKEITTLSTTTAIRINVIKNNNVTNAVFDAAGFILASGTVMPSVYNTGEAITRYEDITSDVLMAKWETKTDKKTLTPQEGVLTLTLDNTTRKYSPRYTGSSLYGYMAHGLRVQVEIMRVNGTYEVMWVGYVSQYKVSPGGYRGDLQATIEATQGIFNMDRTPLVSTIQENVTLPEVLTESFISGWYPASVSHVTVLDESTLDETTWLADPAELMDFEAGLIDFPLIGDDWADSDTRFTKVMKGLIEVERGWLFLDRRGKLVFRNQQHYLSTTSADHTVSIDTQANLADYTYSPVEINTVNITYYPSGESTDQIIWSTRRGVRMRPRGRGKIRPKFTYEEGEKKTVKSLNPFGAGGTDSNISAVDDNGNAIESRYITAEAELVNGGAIIGLRNFTGKSIRVALVLRGTIEIKSDSEKLIISGDNIDIGVRDTTIDNRLLKDEVMADNLANYIITLYGTAFDEFPTLRIEARDTTWLDRMLDITLGDLLSITETQTGVTGKKQLVIGESSTWTPGHLITEFQLSRIDETPYWILGTSELNDNTYLGY